MARYHYIDPEELERDPFAKSSEDQNEFSRLLAEERELVGAARRYRVGDQVTGRVVSVGTDTIFVDLGGKMTGALAIEDLRASGSVTLPKVDEEVTAYVRQDSGSELILTKSLRRSETDDTLLRNAYENHLPIEAKVEKVINGGYEVTVGRKRGFVPFSGMDMQRAADPEAYVGQVFRFHITTFSQGGRNLVLSRRELLQEEKQEKVREVLGDLEPGQTRRATITRLATFGAFADLGGGLEGLIPMSELSWSRVKKPDDVVKVGDTVQVRILRVEHSPRLRISLSLKDAGEDPWVAMATRMVPGSWLEGQVTKANAQGVAVRIATGIEGLVPVRELSWERRVPSGDEIVAVGDVVRVFVLESNVEAQRLVLSLRGPMPRKMLSALEARRRAGAELSADEEAALADSAKMQKIVGSGTGGNREDVSTLAAAFEKAKRRG